jgi:thermitase
VVKKEKMKTQNIMMAVLAGVFLIAAAAVPMASAENGNIDIDTVIIGFPLDADLDEKIGILEDDYEISPLETCEELSSVLVDSVEVPMDIQDKLKKDEKLGIVYIEGNDEIVAVYTPDDTRWSEQWGPQNIKADLAWDCEKGSKSIRIAILDTGIDYNHEDISGNYVSGGYDWFNIDNDPMDDNGHGTMCAGVATAVMDNSKGIAGIAQTEVMAEKVLGDDGKGKYWHTGYGIVHAAKEGADIISMSLGGIYDRDYLRTACEYAVSKGCVLVAAAGNEGSGNILYPAGYDSVICVGAINSSNLRASFSNYGSQMELVAPGVDILSTDLSNKYNTYTGTSAAVPHVAGVAGLIRSKEPGLSSQEVRTKLQTTANDLGASGWDQYYGYGRVNAADICPTNPIPEFATIAIPVAAILGLLFFFNYRKRRKE